ncbi:MAG: hypothetical protein LBR12_00750, partial [Opitutaceae bacterium]|nr:hypothetical protein [Opitutaceae bacterium]
MRLVLTALHDELKRLQYEGVDAIPLAEDTLDALRALAPPPAAAPVETAPPSPPSAAPAGVARKPEPPPPPAPEFPPPPTVALPDTPEKQPRWDALLAQVRADPVCLKNLRPG